MLAQIGSTRFKILQGDIVQQDTEAIVNAANSLLAGGGGVDGAVHRAGGPIIKKECEEIRARQGGCPTGGAVITSGGNLKARFVIHAVGPVWEGGNRKEAELLASAYRSSLQLAAEKGIKSIAFPSLSTGAYGFPVERAAPIALSTIVDYLRSHPGVFEEVRMVLFSASDLAVYLSAWESLSLA